MARRRGSDARKVRNILQMLTADAVRRIVPPIHLTKTWRQKKARTMAAKARRWTVYRRKDELFRKDHWNTKFFRLVGATRLLLRGFQRWGREEATRRLPYPTPYCLIILKYTVASLRCCGPLPIQRGGQFSWARGG